MKFLLLFCLYCALHAFAGATSVVPPDFDHLVRQSEVIFRGRVIAAESGWRTGEKQRWLTTRVTFAVERVLVGGVGETLTLEFAGGAVGGYRTRVAGLPTYRVGDRGVFFVEKAGSRVCPLVRLAYGSYRVVGEGASGDLVVRDNGEPLQSLGDVQLPLGHTAQTGMGARAVGMTLNDFEAAIVSRANDRQARATAEGR